MVILFIVRSKEWASLQIYSNDLFDDNRAMCRDLILVFKIVWLFFVMLQLNLEDPVVV